MAPPELRERVPQDVLPEMPSSLEMAVRLVALLLLLLGVAWRAPMMGQEMMPMKMPRRSELNVDGQLSGGCEGVAAQQLQPGKVQLFPRPR